MSGLVGIWRQDRAEADRSAIAAMLAPLEHRGPDGMGVWHEGRVAFGHRRLAILDPPATASQPMLTGDGTGILICDGEIYNHRALRRELENDGVRFGGTDDTEVLLQALHNWGPERSLPRLNGVFAFAYLDRRREELWLARDRLGTKPLLVANTGAELLFASEAKALLAHPRMETRVDRHALTKWLLERGEGPDDPPFLGMSQLEPGSWWKVSEQGIEKRQYFHALTAIDVDRLVAASSTKPANFVSQFRDDLKRSIELRLESRAPLAVLCSGGVDSSLIAAYAKEQLPELGGYVADIAFPDSEAAEAERVGRLLGIPIRRVVVDQPRFLALWPYAVWHSDGPSTHPSDAALLAVLQTCRADGARILLTGEGADELFGGYPSNRQTYDEWSALTSWRRYLPRSRVSKRIFAHAPFASMAGRSDPALRRRFALALNAEEGLLARRLLARLAPVEPEADRAFIAHNLWSLYHYLPWSLHQHDRMGMAASTVMRLPFLDNQLIDSALHLPRRATLHRGIGKWLVKKAAAEILPADIVYKTKKGFPVPAKFWQGTQHLLVGGMLAELLEYSAETTREIVGLLEGEGWLRFHFVGLELWARIFLGKEAPSALGEKLTALAHDATFKRRR